MEIIEKSGKLSPIVVLIGIDLVVLLGTALLVVERTRRWPILLEVGPILLLINFIGTQRLCNSRSITKIAATYMCNLRMEYDYDRIVMGQKWEMKIQSGPALLKDCVEFLDSPVGGAAFAMQEVHRRDRPSGFYVRSVHVKISPSVKSSITDYGANNPVFSHSLPITVVDLASPQNLEQLFREWGQGIHLGSLLGSGCRQIC